MRGLRRCPMSRRFNPTVVRLKVPPNALGMDPQTRFNPTVVRLKECHAPR